MMKNQIHTYIYSLIAIIAMSLLPLSSQAQEDERVFRDVDFQVSLKNKTNGRSEYEPVQYCVVKSLKKAHDIRIALEKAISQQNEDEDGTDHVEQAAKKQGIVLQVSSNSGAFTVHVETGMAVVIVAQSSMVKVEEIKNNKAKYDVSFETRTLQEVEVLDNRRRGPDFKKVPGFDTGYEVNFTCPVYLPAGYTRSNSRMFLQPIVIDCQTDDTVAYADPIIFEGKEYHNLQVRRMGYNYEKNDPLAKYLNKSYELLDDQPFEYSYTTTFRKPDRDKSYRGSYRVMMEDPNHIFYDNGGLGTGSCLAFRPFKFLNFNVAAEDMPLREEFREDAASKYRAIDRKLTLTFEMGTDKLTQDTLNTQELNKLISEIKSYGDKLYKVQIEGAASAEGWESTNVRLATLRAAKAVNIIQDGLGKNADVRIPAPTMVIHTWNEVADELARQGREFEATEVRELAKSAKNGNPSPAIKRLDYYNTLIEPILATQRTMRCTYHYEVDHVMTPQEALDEYYTFKEDYVSGKKDFSDGDYYNLFSIITDEKEVETLTNMAYRHMLKSPAYHLNKLSPYVANKMALRNIQQGTPNPNILRPFIDYNITTINQKKQINKFSSIIVNRKEILANQAITYFQEMKLDTAQYIIDWLPAGETKSKISNYTDFIRLFFKDRTAKEEQRYNEALNFVLNSSPENRAILFTELRQQLGKSREEAEKYVDELDDNSAKKWYLKGLLYSDIEEIEKNVREKVTPTFLAYFQHSFDIEARYKNFFNNEGAIDDDTRKKHPYQESKIGEYRLRFSELTGK